MQGLWNLIGKVGQGSSQAFPYEIGDKIPGLDGKSIWTLHKGKKKGTVEEVSIFAFDVKNSPPDQQDYSSRDAGFPWQVLKGRKYAVYRIKICKSLGGARGMLTHEVAKAEYKRLKTLRHPNVLRFVDGFESEAFIYMVTEYVEPLEVHLAENRNDLEISWGIHQIASGLDFLINNGNMIHGNICIFSIFVDCGGEWKLGGVAYVQAVTPTKGAEPQMLSRSPWMQKYEPPEGRHGNKPRQKSEKWSPDMWGLGCLIWEVFNGALQKSSSLKSVGKIPGNLLSHYTELVSANPKSRPNPEKFISQCRSQGQYLSNSFVDANLFLAELQMKSQAEQKEFFKSLSPSLDLFPQQFCKDKILPQLLNAFEYGPAGSTVLAPLFKIGKLLEAEEYQRKIVPCVVKLFSSTDRATRIQLLQQLDNFVQYLQPAVVNDQIFPNVAMGFGDTVPAMREHTIKSMLLLTPKLNEKTINNQLLKYFAKLQMDEQPSIRTNTTVCLGKISRYLPEATRQKVIVSAFLRALRDPFPPARMAGINALCVTLEFTPVKDCATRVLPPLCTMTVDPEKAVRDQSFKAIRLILTKVEKYSEETVAKENTSGQPSSPSQMSSDNAPATWTGWAMSSLTSKFYKGGSAGDVSAKGDPIISGDNENKEPANSTTNADRRRKPTAKISHAGRRSEDDANSESDYEDNEWDDDGWGEEKDAISNLRKDLVTVRNRLTSMTSNGDKDTRSMGGDDESDSDFGDWEQDSWTDTNDLPPKQEVKKPSRVKSSSEKPSSGGLKLGVTKKAPVNEDALLSELLGDTNQKKLSPVVESSWDGDWNDMKDSFVQDENWTQDFFQKDSKRTAEKVSRSKPSAQGKMKKMQDNTSEKRKETSAKCRATEDMSSNNTFGDGWDSEDWAPLGDATPRTTSTSNARTSVTSDAGNSGNTGDNWETGGWDDFDNFEESGDTTASKAEIAKKKREEKRRQREQALKEKRAAKGAMKLGTVKKAD